jgi:hypothetical protein
VLLCIAHDPGVRLPGIAARMGITGRTAYSIVTVTDTLCGPEPFGRWLRGNWLSDL